MQAATAAAPPAAAATAAAGDEPSPCVSSSGSAARPTANGTGAAGAAAAGAGMTRAQERLAARIAKLAASGADVSALLQGSGMQLPQAQQLAQQPPIAAPSVLQQLAGPAAGGPAVGGHSLLAGQLEPAAALELPMLGVLGGGGVGGANGAMEDGTAAGASAPPRPGSPLLPLLDFDFDHFVAGTEVGGMSRGAVVPALACRCTPALLWERGCVPWASWPPPPA